MWRRPSSREGEADVARESRYLDELRTRKWTTDAKQPRHPMSARLEARPLPRLGECGPSS